MAEFPRHFAGRVDVYRLLGPDRAPKAPSKLRRIGLDALRMAKYRAAADVLRALGVMTPERVEHIKAAAEARGASSVIHAACAYERAVANYRQGHLRPAALASAHRELVTTLELDSDGLQVGSNRFSATVQQARGPKSKA